MPSVYHDLHGEVLSLPPHQPYDCAIELLPVCVSQNTKREGGGSQLIMAEVKSDGHIFVKFCLGFDGVKLRGEKRLVNNGISNWT